MELELNVGQGEKHLSLLGKACSLDEQICKRIGEGLIRGEVEIEISGDRVSFAYENLAFVVRGNPEELSRIKVLLKECHNKIEPKKVSCDEGYFSGFQMSFA